MLATYFDASNTHDGTTVRVLAGLAGSPKRWAELSSKWRKILDDEGIEDFHASQCATGHDQFHGWEPERRHRLHRRLANLVAKKASWRVWTAVKMDEYAATFQNDPTGKGSFYVNAIGCVSDLRTLSLRQYQGAHFSYVFDQGDRGGDQAFDAFRDLLEADKQDYYRMGALSIDKRQRVLPLQAADLHAYEVYRHLADKIAGIEQPMRPELEALIAIPEAGGYLLTGKRLRYLFGTYFARYGEDSGRREREPIPMVRDSRDRIGPKRVRT